MTAEPLILASSSPRRQAILTQLGVPFRVQAPEVDELTEGEPRALVVQNALLKLRAVPGERVLAVDSMVVWDGRARARTRACWRSRDPRPCRGRPYL